MMKILSVFTLNFLLLLKIFSCDTIKSYVYWNGNIELSENLVITDGGILEISEGTFIVIKKPIQINIIGKGRIIAKGSERYPIIFKPQLNEKDTFPFIWCGIYFYNIDSDSEKSVIEHCIFEYCFNAIRFNTSFNPVLTNHCFQDEKHIMPIRVIAKGFDLCQCKHHADSLFVKASILEIYDLKKAYVLKLKNNESDQNYVVISRTNNRKLAVKIKKKEMYDFQLYPENKNQGIGGSVSFYRYYYSNNKFIEFPYNYSDGNVYITPNLDGLYYIPPEKAKHK